MEFMENRADAGTLTSSSPRQPQWNGVIVEFLNIFFGLLGGLV